jgi:hypothetical protein
LFCPFSDKYYTACHVTSSNEKCSSFCGNGKLQVVSVEEPERAYVNRKDGGIAAFTIWLSETYGHKGGFNGESITETNITKVTWEQVENRQSGSDMNR